jgi:hypothetical protein
LKKVGNIGAEGSKIHANAGERNAASRKRAVEMMGVAEEPLKEAEEADGRPLEAGLAMPEEIKPGEGRKAALEGAKRETGKRCEEAGVGESKGKKKAALPKTAEDL